MTTSTDTTSADTITSFKAEDPTTAGITTIDDWLKIQKDHNGAGSHPCPSCGYCPLCGRGGGIYTHPYYQPPLAPPWSPWSPWYNMSTSTISTTPSR